MSKRQNRIISPFFSSRAFLPVFGLLPIAAFGSGEFAVAAVSYFFMYIDVIYNPPRLSFRNAAL